MNKSTFKNNKELFIAVEEYLIANYLSLEEDDNIFLYNATFVDEAPTLVESSSGFFSEELESKLNLEEMISSLDEPFSTILIRLIHVKEMDEVDVYRRAHIDRKLFSKIRSGKGYQPSKKTVISLALALELSLDEAEALLRCAGYALSPSNKFDVIIEYFIINQEYNIFTINEALFYYDQALLGS